MAYTRFQRRYIDGYLTFRGIASAIWIKIMSAVEIMLWYATLSLTVYVRADSKS